MPFFPTQRPVATPSPFGDSSVFDNKGILGDQPDPSQATGLALLNALQQQQAAGMQRTATPLGSIANNLIPLFGAMVQAHALQAQGQRQALLDKIQLLNAMKGTAASNPEKMAADLAKTKAETAKILAETANPKATKPSYGEGQLVHDSLAQQLGREPTPIELDQGLQQRKQDVAASTQQGLIPGKMDLFKQQEDYRRSQLKDPPGEMINRLSAGIGAVKSLDDAMKGFQTTTGMDILKSTLSGGVLSNPAMRAYSKSFNDLDNARAGARGMTKAALDRIIQEWPNPKMALVDPAGFMAQLQTARDNGFNKLTSDTKSFSERFNIPDEIKGQVVGLTPVGKDTLPKKVTATPTGQNVQLDFNDPQLKSDFEAIREAFPNMTADEMAVYHDKYGAPK